MTRLGPFLVFFVLFALPTWAGAEWCAPDSPPVIVVGLQAADPVGDYTKTIAELERNHIDTVSPYGAQVDSHVGGLTQGDVSVNRQVQISGRRNGDKSCVWVSKVDVVIRLDQTVYVAKEYAPETCMYGSIWEHEHKHVRVDREILNTYRPLFEQAIFSYLQNGAILGPFDKSAEKQMQETLIERMGQVVAQVTNQMEIERTSRQQAVDTLAEYTRVSDVCKGRK